MVVEGRGGGTRVVETDLAGNFVISIGRPARSIEVIAKADGYSPASFSFDLAVEFVDPARAWIIPLTRSAVLDVLVRDRTGAPMAGALVEIAADHDPARHVVSMAPRLSEDGYPTWDGTTDIDGTLALSTLPTSAPLRVSFSAPGWPMQHQPEPLILAPGARRRIELLLGTGTRIAGRLEDESGVAIRWCTIWRAPARAAHSGAFDSSDQPLQTTKTDGAGRFRFDSVPPGEWWIGPAPGAAKGVPALAELVKTDGHFPEVEVVVRVARDLSIEGIVLSNGGLSIAGVTVFASWTLGSASATARSDEDGSFSLGPLVPGAWRLEASAGGAGTVTSEPIEVQAGLTNVVVELGE